MKLNSRARLQLRLQSGVFLILFIALLTLLGWLSQRYPVSIDMSTSAEAKNVDRKCGRLATFLLATMLGTPVNPK